MATTDPTAKQAASTTGGLSPQQKIEEAFDFINETGTGMLTTRSPQGKLASRAMIPATTSGLVLSYYINTESGKTDDIETDPSVNVSYVNPKTGDWASISGKAVLNKDKAKVKSHWSSKLSAWFDNKGDGVHTGDANDPRVAFLEVHPDEIRYFKADGKLKFLVASAKAAVSGKAASGGQLIIINNDELQLAGRLHTA